MVRIPGFHCCDPASVPGQGAEILQAEWCSQKKLHWNKQEKLRHTLPTSITASYIQEEILNPKLLPEEQIG